MIFQDDPTQIARDVERVLSREEFRYDPSWFDRVTDWLSRQLDRLFGDAEVPAGATPSFGGGIGSILAWLLIVAAAAGIVAVVVYVVRNRIRRTPDGDGEELSISVEHQRRASDWDRDAARLEADGDWKGALRARYRQLVRTLVDRRQLPDVAGRTTGELRQDLAVTTPSAADAFDTASLLFELGWYAHLPVERGEYDAFRVAAAAVIDSPVLERIDGRSGGRRDGSGLDGTSIEVHV
uniref:Integral membrane protein n=1 Tax=uncultured bacterium A1Q1_fos_568 TaxID=1256586 RepID=L7VYD8_9BACT|nr:integral membrane protein [uncultured bacterium A1Q1_fos_568]